MGFVLRLNPVEDADKRTLEVALAGADRPRASWVSVASKPVRIDAGWHHVAVSRTTEGIGLYHDGKPVATRDCRKQAFRGSVRPISIGAPKDAIADRQLFADVAGLRLSGKARYAGQWFKPARTWKRDEQTHLLLDFERPARDRVIDLAGKNHHGTLVGARWETE